MIRKEKCIANENAFTRPTNFSLSTWRQSRIKPKRDVIMPTTLSNGKQQPSVHSPTSSIYKNSFEELLSGVSKMDTLDFVSDSHSECALWNLIKTMTKPQ
mmetsp:Transcript_19593/g.22797  ORF Transcript_19593/g.22797 Transcript_19593/m.22797 type:complete len:100 (-) Transcript_19593:83-382(-)